jgi:hypothetical protein
MEIEIVCCRVCSLIRGSNHNILPLFEYNFVSQVNGWAFSRIMDGPDSNAYWHPLFLRGLPSLAYKMKRPPKEKNSAAAARTASGATATECPNFLLIAKIAPLPPATPYTISNEGKIHPLKVNEQQEGDSCTAIESIEGIHLMDWASPPPLTSNPFDSDSPSSYESGQQKTPPVAANETKKDDDQKDDASKQDITTCDDGNTKVAQGRDARESLSEIDLRYLANQNRLLLMYVVQNQETEQHESPVPGESAPVDPSPSQGSDTE